MWGPLDLICLLNGTIAGLAAEGLLSPAQLLQSKTSSDRS